MTVAGDMRAPQHYVLTVLAVTVVLLTSIPAVNIAVDPYGYARLVGWRPANPNDAEASFAAGGAWPAPSGTREAKMLNVAYYQPQSVVFGSSTVWSHIDTGYAPLRGADGRPAFNFGLAGVSLREMEAAFAHVLALRPPARVLLGLEFYMFSADKATSPGFFELPMAQRQDYSGQLKRFVSSRLFTAECTFESQAQLWAPVTKRLRALAGGRALFRQPGPNFGIGVGAGLRPVDAVSASPGPGRTRDDFLRLMLDGDRVIISGLYPPPGQPFRFVDDAGWSSLEAVRRMVALARQHRVDLRIYLSPHHARAYEAIRLMGWWPKFEAWQRGLVEILAEDAAAHAAEPAIPLWDFGGYTSVTLDPVVTSVDSAGYSRFHDAIHFATAVGYMVIDRLLPTAAAQPMPDDFGVRLTASTVDYHLAAVRQTQQHYGVANQAEVSAVSEMLKSLGRLPPVAP